MDPAGREGQLAYLTTLRYIGPARAEQLLERHGDDVLEVIAANPHSTFSRLRGLSRRQAEAATDSWHASRAVRDLHVQLAPHGLAHLAGRLHAKYGADAMRVLHEDPYALTEVEGVGFQRADVIALAADVPPESDRRAQAAAAFVLTEAERQGHSHLPLPELRRRAGALLGLDPDPAVLASAPGLLAEEDASTASHPRLRARGRRDPRRARRRARATSTTTPAPSRARPDRGAVGRRPRRLRLAPLDHHRRPRGRQDRLHPRDRRRGAAAHLRIALCAPTGRAARRMEEATGPAARPSTGCSSGCPGSEPGYRPGHPLPADLVVVDEASMLNLRLAEVLLGGIAESTHLVFVGDADQLPPVGAGKPFARADRGRHRPRHAPDARSSARRRAR